MHGPKDLNVRLFWLFRQFTNLQLRRASRYPGQGLILISLKDMGTLTQRELTEITKRRPATMSEQLDNMERAGLIERKKNENDKRTIDVSLTARGLETAQEAERERAEAAAVLFTGLTEEEKDALQKLLSKLVDSLSEEE